MESLEKTVPKGDENVPEVLFILDDPENHVILAMELTWDISLVGANLTENENISKWLR